MSSVKHWLKTHKSANFISFVIILGIVLLTIGIVLPTNTKTMNYISILVFQLSGAAITTGILTIFFNFDDVKNYMAKSVSNLWMEGKIVHSLSPATQEKIDKELILCGCSEQMENIEESLYQDLSNLRKTVLSNFMLKNYKVDVTLVDFNKDKNLLIHHTVTSYRIQKYHLKDSYKIFPLRVEYLLNIPTDSTLTKKDILRNFKIKAGTTLFTEADLEYDPDITPSGIMRSVKLKFSKEIKIDQFLDVSMELETLSTRNNNNEIIIMRWPTQGLNVSMRYTDQYDYQGYLFKSITLPKNIESINDEENSTKSGISVSTNDWVLPGYGAVMAWYNKQ